MTEIRLTRTPGTQWKVAGVPDGIERAKAKGTKFGRKSVLDASQSRSVIRAAMPLRSGDGLVNGKQVAYETKIQKPQGECDQHGRHYNNDVASDWRRGMGPQRAEGRPGFDHSKPRARR